LKTNSNKRDEEIFLTYRKKQSDIVGESEKLKEMGIESTCQLNRLEKEEPYYSPAKRTLF
jgi:hypothetical protein